MTTTVVPIDPLAATHLIAELDAYLQRLYPPESNHLTSVDQLRNPNVLMFAVQESLAPALSVPAVLPKPTVPLVSLVPPELMAIAAVRLVRVSPITADRPTSYGEIKRLYVPPAHRGKGLAKALIVRLETELRDRQIRWAKLETGIAQPEAIALYERLGYHRCAPFGDYTADPLSVFMEKDLGQDINAPGR
jgi:putative acetyltransferase